MNALFVFFVSMTATLIITVPSIESFEQEPCTIVIFGASGDLTARKLIPALYQLTHNENISNNTAIVGFARREYTHEGFRKIIRQSVDQLSKLPSKNNSAWKQFEKNIFYNPSDFDDDGGYKNLHKLLLKINKERGTKGNRIYYLATHPSHFSTIIKKLHENELIYNANDAKEKWSRVIIEKPFGSDLDSATRLHEDISNYLSENQIYRMDHYLAKEGVQNLLALRFKNALFEPLWNNKNIDNVQITLSEDIGIGSRASFWEETGSLRDVFQNHLMQLLAIVAMDQPLLLDSFNIHQEKIKALKAIRPFSTKDMSESIVRGQYGPGLIEGKKVVGYKQEVGVSDRSLSETFIAAKILIDNPRWRGVPFYIRGGKRLLKQTTEIAITFKDNSKSAHAEKLRPNILFIRIQPNASIFIKTQAKVPMLETEHKPVVFGFSPDSYYKTSSPEAYEKLFYDCIKGDQSLYVDAEEQLAAWRLLSPILNYWKSKDSEEMHTYDAGSFGPNAANQLPEKNGHSWHLLED